MESHIEQRESERISATALCNLVKFAYVKGRQVAGRIEFIAVGVALTTAAGLYLGEEANYKRKNGNIIYKNETVGCDSVNNKNMNYSNCCIIYKIIMENEISEPKRY